MTSFKLLIFGRCVPRLTYVVIVSDTCPFSCLRHPLHWTWLPYPKLLPAALWSLVRVIRRSRPNGLSFQSLLVRTRSCGRVVACPQTLF
jgi:hypothetical protein